MCVEVDDAVRAGGGDPLSDQDEVLDELLQSDNPSPRLSLKKKTTAKIKEAAGKKAEHAGTARKGGGGPDRSAYKCLVCLQAFPVTMKKDALEQHAASKHAKLSLNDSGLPADVLSSGQAQEGHHVRASIAQAGADPKCAPKPRRLLRLPRARSSAEDEDEQLLALNRRAGGFGS
jgi:hypothetical protein